MIQIYSLRLDQELNEKERQQALDILTPERKAKALRFRRLEDQTRSLAAGVLEAYALWKSFGISKEERKIQKGEQGKPYLPAYEKAQYNLSHSGAWVVCGTSDCPLGIDVEQAGKYQERLVRRFFHPEEVEDILEHSESERSYIFAEYWTMKESFMKFCGTGFALPLNNFRTDRESGRVSILPGIKKDIKLQLKELGISEETNPYCRQIPLEKEYACMVCTLEDQEIMVEPVGLKECVEALINV